MIRTSNENKSDKRILAEQEFRKLIEGVCLRGFHGTASVTVSVQDGHIQNMRVAVERKVR